MGVKKIWGKKNWVQKIFGSKSMSGHSFWHKLGKCYSSFFFLPFLLWQGKTKSTSSLSNWRSVGFASWSGVYQKVQLCFSNISAHKNLSKWGCFKTSTTRSQVAACIPFFPLHTRNSQNKKTKFFLVKLSYSFKMMLGLKWLFD